MFSGKNLQRKRDGLQKLYDQLEEKTLFLRKARIIAVDPLVIFRLDKQIEEAEAERDKVAQELDALEQKLKQEN